MRVWAGATIKTPPQSIDVDREMGTLYTGYISMNHVEQRNLHPNLAYPVLMQVLNTRDMAKKHCGSSRVGGVGDQLYKAEAIG